MEKQGTVLMHRYELGRYLGQGTFAKVYQARNILTGEMVAMKIIDKERIERVGMTDQIKREIAVMRLIRHPNVVRLIEVMATRSKIYFAMEFVRGGELFCRVARGRLSEDEARRYFGQLVAAVDFCHSRGVYHRDLKPENLLLDEQGDLKVSDFGLSALVESQRKDGLLHTTCGTPAYVAPEVIGKKGYDGAKADIWSCGVILFVLLAGYLPFHDSSLIEMYRKISRGEFSYPKWFPADARKLLNRVLDPNPSTRISISKVIESPWLRKGFKLAKSVPDPETKPTEWEDIFAVAGEASAMRPTRLNAFDIISRSQGLDLSRLFETGKRKRASSSVFTTRKTAAAVVSKLEEIAAAERFKVRKTERVVRMHGITEGRKGKLAIEAEIFEVAPELLVVELKKAAGDTLEYQRFCSQGLRPSLEDIIWSWQGGSPHQSPPVPSPHQSPPAPEPPRPMAAAGLPPLPPARRR